MDLELLGNIRSETFRIILNSCCHLHINLLMQMVQKTLDGSKATAMATASPFLCKIRLLKASKQDKSFSHLMNPLEWLSCTHFKLQRWNLWSKIDKIKVLRPQSVLGISSITLAPSPPPTDHLNSSFISPPPSSSLMPTRHYDNVTMAAACAAHSAPTRVANLIFKIFRRRICCF